MIMCVSAAAPTGNVPQEKLQGGPPPAGFDGYGGYPPQQPQHQQQTPYPPAGASSGYPPQQQQPQYQTPYPPAGASGYPPQQQQQQWGAPYGQQQQQQQWGAPVANGMPVPPPGPPRANTIGSGSYTVNIDPDTEVAQKFAETVVRNGFVRKVGVLYIQHVTNTAKR